MSRWIAMITLATAACGGSEAVAPSAPPPAPPAVTPLPAASRVHVQLAGGVVITGDVLAATVSAAAADGQSVPATGASYTLSGPLEFLGADLRVVYPTGGRPVYLTNLRVLVKDAGHAVLTVNLGGAVDSAAFDIPPIVSVSDAMVIDSLSVVEYMQPCGSACRVLAYTPYLRFKVPAGRAAATMLRFELAWPYLSMDSCNGDLTLASGGTADIFSVDPYIYNNDFIYLAPTNSGVPDATVNVRALVRTSTGAVGWITKTGGIQRGGSFDDLPHSANGVWNWSCS